MIADTTAAGNMQYVPGLISPFLKRLRVVDTRYTRDDDPNLGQSMRQFSLEARRVAF
jgi:hypothetical protein